MANAHRLGRPRGIKTRQDQKIVQTAISAGRSMLSYSTKSFGNEQKMILFTCLIVPTTFSTIETKIITEPIRLEMGITIVNHYFSGQRTRDLDEKGWVKVLWSDDSKFCILGYSGSNLLLGGPLQAPKTHCHQPAVKTWRR